MTHTDSSDSDSSSSYHVLLAPPAGTAPVNNPHNIALRLFNRDPTSPIQSIVFGSLHCYSGLLFARTTTSTSSFLLYVVGNTTKNPGLYAPGGALLEEHLVGVTTFSLLDLYARPEALLPRGFQPAPRQTIFLLQRNDRFLQRTDNYFQKARKQQQFSEE